MSFGIDRWSMHFMSTVFLKYRTNGVRVPQFQLASIINFKMDDMTPKFGLFSKNKINNLYLTETMVTYWLHMLDD